MEIGICHQGNGVLTIDKRQFSYSSGMISIIPANCPHDLFSEQEDFWEFIYISPVQMMQELYPNRNKIHEEKLAMMIPGVATMIPLFTMMSKMKFINTVWGFVLPALSTPFLIMMFRQNSRTFPAALMDAARIDGLPERQIFFKIYMPVMKATYAAAGVITFMNAWNAYLWPRVVLTSNNAQTMPILIANLANGYTIDYGMLMMGVLFCSLPTVIIFFILQKQFAEGITGAVK